MALTIPSTRRLWGTVERCQLADALGDSPETALPVHSLRKGCGQVYMAGDLPDFKAVIIEDYDVGPELLAYGSDVESFLQILAEITEWEALNASGAIGRELASAIQVHLKIDCHTVDDIYQVPSGPVAIVPNPDVRLLTTDDIPLLDATPEDIRLGFEEDLRVVLAEEAVAAAIADGMIVATGSTYGLAEPFADVAISTLEPYRCRGYARAAASLVCAETQKRGHTPIWSCAPTNLSSLQVANRLGFREVSRRVNIVLDR